MIKNFSNLHNLQFICVVWADLRDLDDLDVLVDLDGHGDLSGLFWVVRVV